jgi:hypothetical protein
MRGRLIFVYVLNECSHMIILFSLKTFPQETLDYVIMNTICRIVTDLLNFIVIKRYRIDRTDRFNWLWPPAVYS